MSGPARAARTQPSPLGDQVKVEPYGPGQGLPVFVTPADPILGSDLGAAVTWVRTHEDLLDDYLCEAGAVVLRGFAFRDTGGFEQAIAHYPDMPHGYTGGASPRNQIQGRVFEATHAPAAAKLPFHQEMAYLPVYPRKVAFFCNKPAETGGETLIADVRRFDARAPRALRERIKAKGVRYTRNFRSLDWSSGDATLDTFHRPWTEAFGTQDKAEVEAGCKAMGLGCAWNDNGSVSVVYTAPGLVRHPRTGREIWFNQIMSQTQNRHALGDERLALYETHYGASIPRPYHTTYGDGAPFDPEHLDALFPILDELEVAFPWRQGDLMLLDNFYTFHGRGSFTGQRDVQVALLG